jgi:hypothetical protein
MKLPSFGKQRHASALWMLRILLLSLLPVPYITAAQLRLQWIDNSSDETGFCIERRPGPANEPSFVQLLVVDSNVTTYTDSTVSVGTEYTYRVRATNQTGNSAYTDEVSATAKLDQTITFAALGAKVFGESTFTVLATSSSLLPVSFSSSNPSVATVSGNTVTIVGAGTTTITASQPGDGTYSAAPDVPQTLIVSKAAQTITFPGILPCKVGDAPFVLAPTSSSGLPVTLTSSDTSVATVSGFTVTVVGVGTTTITASQSGNSNYLAATSVPQMFVVGKGDQTITFAALAAKTYLDAPFIVSATASSGLPVTFTSSNTAVATVSGSTVTIVGAGSTTITATQAGNATFNAASDVDRSLVVAKANQTISFGALSGKTFGDPPFAVSATASSGLAVSFSIASGPATISGNTVTLTGADTVVVRASQAGSANFNAAPDVDRSFVVTGAAPVFTVHPISQTVAPGTNMTFTVAVTAAPAATFQWERSTDGGFNWAPLVNDATYAGVTTATMTIIATPQVYNGYRYRAVATNGLGSATSNEAILTVNPDAPAFTTQPTNQSVITGANASFTVAASGNPAPTFVWQLSTNGGATWNPVPNVSPYSGVTSATLTITGAPLALNSNQYRAVATNTIASANSSAATLTVTGIAPAFSTQPANQSTSTNGNATFSVVASGTPTPTLQWQISTNGGATFGNLTNTAPYSGVTTSTLTITGAPLTLNGAQYRAVATNSVSATNSNSASLTVTTPPPPPPPSSPPPPPPVVTTVIAPTITAQPVSQTVVAPARVSFTVGATGTALSYQWRKNGTNVSGATGSTFTLSSANLADAGSYSVLVFNSANSVASSPATLTVETAPIISSQPVGQTVVAGSNVSFSVEAQGIPAPTYEWRKNGVVLTGQTSATLSLTGVGLDAAGTYSVVLSNAHGSATSAGAELLVNKVNVAGFYFGTFPDGGSWALTVRPDNTATYLAYLPSSSTAIVTELTIAADGSFSVSGSTLASSDAASSVLGNSGRPIAAAAVPFTLVGKIANGQLTGQLLDKPLSGAVDQGSYASAGVYKASALLTATGTTYSIVGPSGRSLVITTTPTSVDAATGTVGANNQLTTATVSGGQVALTLIPDSKSIAATYSASGSTTPVTFSGVQDTVRITSALANLSIRSTAGTGSQTLIVGFAIAGGDKPILIRGIGPGLAAFNVAGTLPDPRIDLNQSGSATLAGSNDNWAASAADVFAQVGAFALSVGSRDAAIVTTLGANSYTAQLSDSSGSNGVALLELYDTASNNGAKLVNVSARSQVGTGGGILISGLNVSGTGPRTLLIRGIGPALAAFGVSGALADPRLDLFASGGTTPLASNDNWDAATAGMFAPVGAFNLTAGSRDAVLLVTLNPGTYTAQVSGVDNTTGVALVEVYEVP